MRLLNKILIGTTTVFLTFFSIIYLQLTGKLDYKTMILPILAEFTIITGIFLGSMFLKKRGYTFSLLACF